MFNLLEIQINGLEKEQFKEHFSDIFDKYNYAMCDINSSQNISARALSEEYRTGLLTKNHGIFENNSYSSSLPVLKRNIVSPTAIQIEKILTREKIEYKEYFIYFDDIDKKYLILRNNEIFLDSLDDLTILEIKKDILDNIANIKTRRYIRILLNLSKEHMLENERNIHLLKFSKQLISTLTEAGKDSFYLVFSSLFRIRKARYSFNMLKWLSENNYIKINKALNEKKNYEIYKIAQKYPWAVKFILKDKNNINNLLFRIILKGLTVIKNDNNINQRYLGIYWNKTKAFSINEGNYIYINLKGNYEYGNVKKGIEYSILNDEILKNLEQLNKNEYGIKFSPIKKEKKFAGKFYITAPDFIIEANPLINFKIDFENFENYPVLYPEESNIIEHKGFAVLAGKIIKQTETRIQAIDVLPTIFYIMKIKNCSFDGKIAEDIFNDDYISNNIISDFENKSREHSNIQAVKAGFSLEEEQSILKDIQKMGYGLKKK